jgi:hypothetical protein
METRMNTHRRITIARWLGSATVPLLVLAACSGSTKHSASTTTTFTGPTGAAVGGSSTSRPAGPTTSAGPATSTSPPITGAPGATVAADVGQGKVSPCRLLTQAEATTVTGQPMKPGVEEVQQNGPLTIRNCSWVLVTKPADPSRVYYVTVSVVQPPDGKGVITPRQYYEDAKAAFSVTTPVAHVGDEAFAVAGGTALYVMKGTNEVVVLLKVGGNPLDASVSVAKLALARL